MPNPLSAICHPPSANPLFLRRSDHLQDCDLLIRRLRWARRSVELRHEVLYRERLRMPAWIPVRIRDHRGHDRRAQVRPLFAERLELVEGHPFGECGRRKLVLQLRHVCAAQSQG